MGPLDQFVHAYNHHHRHTGIGMHTPAGVHHGVADAIDRGRDAARRQHRPAPSTLTSFATRGVSFSGARPGA